MDQEQKETVRLLIIDGSSSEAEGFLNAFRDAGFATRAHHVTSMESLDEALAAQRKWDLLLISDTELPEDLPVADVLGHIQQRGWDIPAIVVADTDDDASEYYKLGVRNVIPHGDDELLTLVAEREIEDLQTRRNYRRMSVALNESEKQRRNLLDDQVDAILYLSEGIIRYSNPAFNELVGLDSHDDLAGKEFAELVAEPERKEVGEFLLSIEETGQALAAIQCLLVNKAEETESPVRAVVSPTSYEGQYTLTLLVRPQDTESNKEEVQKTLQEAQPDSDTLLYDKHQFEDMLDMAVQRVVAGKDKLALLCITLDSLRTLHAKGGTKLSQPFYKEVSIKLGKSLIEEKACSWSGDCFMALVKAGDEKAVESIGKQILSDLTEEKISIGDEEVQVQISLGAILLGDTSNDLKTLQIRAKHAATLSMKQGGNKLNFYQARKIKQVDSVEKHLAGMVSQALKNDSFRLMYQPVVSLKGCSEKHFDVQLRMADIRGREHSSVTFRNKLDKSALWSKVDRWQVIQAGKDLIDSHASTEKVRLFFHLGGNAFNEKEFLPWLGVALKAAKIPASSIIVEISEQNIVRFQQEAPEFFNRVKAMGCCTGVSEFGCSLSPLETIKLLNIDYVKLDASFTKDLTSEDKGAELKEMIQNLAAKGQKVVVPEVESAVEMAPLWHSGVDFIQGDFIQAPSEMLNLDFDGEF